MLWANESHNELIRSTLESLNRETKKIMEQEPDLDVDAEIREGVPANVIVQTALDENYDLIVIGKRGMGVLEELVMGNIARKVVDLSKVPVTIIP